MLIITISMNLVSSEGGFFNELRPVLHGKLSLYVSVITGL